MPTQLEELRVRVKEIRIAKKWLQEYRINAPPSLSEGLSAYYNFLVQQEEKTIKMEHRISKEEARFGE